MDPNTTAIVISIIAVGGVVIGLMIALIRQSSRHDADIANLSAEFRAEFRDFGHRIENRLALDDRLRAVEQRQARNPQSPDPDDAPDS